MPLARALLTPQRRPWRQKQQQPAPSEKTNTSERSQRSLKSNSGHPSIQRGFHTSQSKKQQLHTPCGPWLIAGGRATRSSGQVGPTGRKRRASVSRLRSGPGAHMDTTTASIDSHCIAESLDTASRSCFLFMFASVIAMFEFVWLFAGPTARATFQPKPIHIIVVA